MPGKFGHVTCFESLLRLQPLFAPGFSRAAAPAFQRPPAL